MREAVVVAVVGRGRQQQQVVAVSGEPLGELVALRALDIVAAAGRALRVRAALVGLVDDDQVPTLLPDALPHAVLLGVVDRGDDPGLALPEVEKLVLVVPGVQSILGLAARRSAPAVAGRVTAPLTKEWIGLNRGPDARTYGRCIVGRSRSRAFPVQGVWRLPAVGGRRGRTERRAASVGRRRRHGSTGPVLPGNREECLAGRRRLGHDESCHAQAPVVGQRSPCSRRGTGDTAATSDRSNAW